jgi:hypothetical protein
MSRADDLVPLFFPPPRDELGFRQGTVVEFDLSTGENVIDVGGTQLVDVPLLSVVDSVSLEPGTVVALLTWKSSWWIIGRVILANSPGFGQLCVFENNGEGVCITKNGIDIYPPDPPANVARIFAQHFLDGRMWLEMIPPRTSGGSGDNRLIIEGGSTVAATAGSFSLLTAGDGVVQAAANLTCEGGTGLGIFRSTGTVFLESFGSDVAVLAAGNAFIDGDNVFITAVNGSVDITSQASNAINLTSDDIINAQAQGTVFIDAQAGQIQLISSTNQCFIDHTTTASAANCFIAVNGLIQRSTSSQRYKTDIEDVTVDLDAVLRLRPRTWRDKAEVVADPGTTNWHIGFIAEELDELGLTAFVEYDEHARPEGIAYDRLSVALIDVIKHQDARLRAIESRLTALDGIETTPTAPEPTPPKPRRRPRPGEKTARQRRVQTRHPRRTPRSSRKTGGDDRG